MFLAQVQYPAAYRARLYARICGANDEIIADAAFVGHIKNDRFFSVFFQRELYELQCFTPAFRSFFKDSTLLLMSTLIFLMLLHLKNNSAN